MITADSLIEQLLDYCRDIIDGNIKACKKHKWACQRFLDDLEKADNEDYPYFFDKNELYRFFMWCHMFKHRVGILAKKPIVLTPYQLFICGNIFCWKKKKNGYRRFRKAYIQVGRKNAKSQLLACIATYECFVSEEQSEVYITGWTRDGSDIVYREIKYQLDVNTPKLLKGKYKTTNGKITHIKDGSFIKPLSKEARNSDSANNPSLAIVDEYKDHLTSEIYDSLLSGMVARPQPLIVIITTAGPSLTSPCMAEYQYVSKILDPDINGVENDQYFVLICELESTDDIKDESCWIKANPIVCSYEGGIDFLRGELESALAAPEKMRNFLTKNMNMWVNMRLDGYMDMKKWNEAEYEGTLEDFAGEECIAGADLSTKLDLTSIAFEFYRDGIYYTFQHSWMPQETFDKRMREGRYRFDLWRDEGDLTICPGPVIDYSWITDFIHEQEDKYGIIIKEITYDPMNATQWIQDMEFEGYTCVEIRQGPFTLNEPTKDFRDQLYCGKLMHSKDGLYSWAASNAVATQHKQEYIMLDKKKSAEKIDPMAATMNAHCRATKVLAVEKPKGLFYSPKREKGKEVN